jgi:DNA-binding NarL/FixJ family response regulator
MSPIRIVREGLASMLGTQPDLCIVGEVGTGTEAIVQVSTLRPDILLLDLELPDIDGVGVLERVRSEFHATIIFQKLGVANRAEAVAKALHDHLIPS